MQSTRQSSNFQSFGRITKLQKDFKLLSLDGMGDRRPTALMRKIMALNDDPKTLKTALFLANLPGLPSDLRIVLLSHNLTELSDIAATANKIWEAQRTSLQHTSSITKAPPCEDVALSQPAVDAVTPFYRPPHKLHPYKKKSSTNVGDTICFYHTPFGPNARRCQPGCKFASHLEGNKPGVGSTSSARRNTLSVCDKKSGISYLVDTGADVSVYPATKKDRHSSKLSTPLVAANGTSIKSWETKKLVLHIGPKSHYQHKFQIADVTRLILGADFIEHNILIDLKNRSLSSATDKSFSLQTATVPSSLAGLSFTDTLSTYANIAQDFLELFVPHFDSTVNKHGVEYHIITKGQPAHARARRLDQTKLTAV